jgi:beta-galactosidase/beta-glucuronidase
MVKGGKDATIVVRARDNYRDPQPRGKQSPYYSNVGCLYTRTTGIWQTVWLEPVPESHLERPRLDWDASNHTVRLAQPLIGIKSGMVVRATISDAEGEISRLVKVLSPGMAAYLDLPIPAKRVHLWQPGDGYLYDVTIELVGAGGDVIDTVDSYIGLRTLAIVGKAVLINGKPVFQRLVLDQGFYPDGILTAPTDAALAKDIELSMAAGFNGARLHQKVFEERFLYHADRLGYLVWGEFPDWGYRKDDGHYIQPPATYITQWIEVLQRDLSHPAIVGWCPLNETWETLGDRFSMLDEVMRGMWLAAKTVDGTRPVLDTSGYSHRVRETDVYDSHDYEQDVVRFRANHAGTRQDQPFYNGPAESPWSFPYNGQPYFVSEFGGIWWNPKAQPGDDSWGYGERVKSLEEWYARFKGLVDVLLDDASMFAYCYTQLTDVYQEQNGIYTFEREAKFDVARLRAVQARKAAIEG